MHIECTFHLVDEQEFVSIMQCCVFVSSPLSPVAPLQSPGLTLDRCSVRRNGSNSATLSSSPDHTLSASSDSGLSSASLRTEGWARTPQPSQQERVELKRLLSGFGLDEMSRGCAAPDPPLLGPPLFGPLPSLENGPKQRETDILDDEALASRHNLHSADSLGTLSSSYHKSSQNSLLSDGFGSPGRTDQPHVFQHAGYSTQTWVHQQQLVAAQQYLYLPEEDAAEERFNNHLQDLLPKAAGEQNKLLHCVFSCFSKLYAQILLFEWQLSETMTSKGFVCKQLKRL